MSKPSSYNFIFSQIFSKKFTDDNLARFIENPVDMPVYLPQHVSDRYYEVPFKTGKRGLAIITSGWGEIVEACKIKVDDICVFNFFNCPDYGLSLSVFTG